MPDHICTGYDTSEAICSCELDRNHEHDDVLVGRVGYGLYRIPRTMCDHPTDTSHDRVPEPIHTEGADRG